MSVDINTLAGDPQPAPQEVSSVPTTESKGEQRLSVDLHEGSIVGTKTFELKSTTEQTDELQVVDFFSTYYNISPARMEPWQAQFVDTMRKQVETVAGQRPISTIPEEELLPLIRRVAADFNKDNKNLELIVKMHDFSLRTLQEALQVDITATDILDPNIDTPTPDEIAGGPKVDRYRGTTPINTITGNIVRRIIGNKAITLPEKINEIIDQFPGAVRPAILQHLTASERSRYISEVHSRQVKNATNKASDYNVDFPPPAGQVADFTGLSDAQIIYLQSLGLEDGENYGSRSNPNNSNESMTTFMRNKLKTLTRARVDFYTSTGLDISLIKINFRDTTQIQPGHTLREREAIRGLVPGADAEDVRLAISEAAADAVTAYNLRVKAEREEVKRTGDTSVTEQVQNRIADLEKPKSEATIKLEKERIEKLKKIEEENLERANEKKELEKQKKEADKRVKEVEDSGADTTADFAAYDTWPSEKKTLEGEITALEAEKAKYEAPAATLTRLRAELAKLNDNLVQIKASNPPKGATAPSTSVTELAAKEISRQIKAKEKELQKKEGILISITVPDIDIRMGEIGEELVKKRAALERIRNGPEDWDDAKIARVKSRKDAKDEITRLNGRISSGGYPAESPEEIQKKIDDLTKQINRAADPDKFAQITKEAWIEYRNSMLTSDKRREFSERLDLVKAGLLQLPAIKFYDNWPQAHLQAIQGLFGREAIIAPAKLAEVTKLLSPERFKELYNLRHPGAITDRASLMALTQAAISAQDLQFMWDSIHESVVGTADLGLVPQDIQRYLQDVTQIKPDATTPKPKESDAQVLEQYNFYYRDVADLQLRILAGWAEAAGMAPEDYYKTNTKINRERIQKAALMAQEVDRLRRRRLEQSYGNTEPAQVPATPTP